MILLGVEPSLVNFTETISFGIRLFLHSEPIARTVPKKPHTTTVLVGGCLIAPH